MNKVCFADLHIHLLCDVDDGAQSEEEMKRILDAAYEDGTRIICATPHFHLGYFGDNIRSVEAAYSKLKKYALKYDDLTLALGNELRFSPNFSEWLESDMCKTINGTKYVLVDFLENDVAEYIVSSVLQIVNRGYIPVLAHAERYEKFSKDFKEIKQLKQCGVIIQIDAQSLFGDWSRGSKKRSRQLIKAYLADYIASDAHNVTYRPPQMSKCYEYVLKKCGEGYAQELFWNNPLKILNNESL